jgi:hypothetical protein
MYDGSSSMYRERREYENLSQRGGYAASGTPSNGHGHPAMPGGDAGIFFLVG